MGEAVWVRMTTLAGGLGVANALLRARREAPAGRQPRDRLLLSSRPTTRAGHQ